MTPSHTLQYLFPLRSARFTVSLIIVWHIKLVLINAWNISMSTHFEVTFQYFSLKLFTSLIYSLWAWGVEEQLLISLPCWASGRVKKLQGFMKFFLQVSHSANLKHLKSMWRQLIILIKLQNHNIKCSGHSAWSASRWHSGMVNLGCLLCVLTNYESVYTWVTHLHIAAVPTITCSLHYA